MPLKIKKYIINVPFLVGDGIFVYRDTMSMVTKHTSSSGISILCSILIHSIESVPYDGREVTRGCGKLSTKAAVFKVKLMVGNGVL